jgi:hypothetical protein
LVLFLVVPLGIWLALTWTGILDDQSLRVRQFCRDVGYAALLALLIPYLYVERRFYLFRSFGNLTRLIRWHIGASYLAVALILIHSRGRLFGPALTTGIVIAFAVVMVTGIAGFFAQKLVYRLMALVVPRELGREALTAHRQILIDESNKLIDNYALLVRDDVRDWPRFCAEVLKPKTVLNKKILEHKMFSRKSREAIRVIQQAGDSATERVEEVIDAVNALLQRQDFCRSADARGLTVVDELNQLLDRAPQGLSGPEVERRNRLFLEAACPELIRKSQPPPQTVRQFFLDEAGRYLRAPFPSWRWLFSREALEPVADNHYQRVRALTAPDQWAVIDQLWQWVQERRQLDLEFWFHRLARAWLLVHGPVAAALLVLVAFHVFSSIYYGGLL